MDAILPLALLVGLAGASLRWGHDSRPGFDPSDYDEARGRIAGLLAEAQENALVRSVAPAKSRTIHTLGAFLVATGRRLESYGERIVLPSRFAATSDGSIHRGL